jgi:uncharacterized protein (TIGR03086 family)
MGVPVANHSQACRGFSAIVAQGEGRWANSSPCPDWDAGGIVEHVIGFHDVLLLRPLQVKPVRPKGDPATRWDVTVPSIRIAMNLATPSADRADRGSDLDLARLLPALTTDVLVHTWDLAKAVGVEPRLDPELCETSLRAALTNEKGLRSSDMFGPEVPVSEGADPATRLIALLGRDPEWTP